LRDPRFAAVEDALTAGDAATALTQVKILPEEVQQHLTPWQGKLETRAAIDAALQEVSAALTAPMQEKIP
jgi:hypothetical protein